MTRIRLINNQRELVTEFTREDFNENEIDLVEYTDRFGKRSLFIFADKTEDGVVVYRTIEKVARVSSPR